MTDIAQFVTLVAQQLLLAISIDGAGFEALRLTIGNDLGSCSHFVTIGLQGREGIQTTRGEHQVDFQQFKQVVVHKRHLQSNHTLTSAD